MSTFFPRCCCVCKLPWQERDRWRGSCVKLLKCSMIKVIWWNCKIGEKCCFSLSLILQVQYASGYGQETIMDNVPLLSQTYSGRQCYWYRNTSNIHTPQIHKCTACTKTNAKGLWCISSQCYSNSGPELPSNSLTFHSCLGEPTANPAHSTGTRIRRDTESFQMLR